MLEMDPRKVADKIEELRVEARLCSLRGDVDRAKVLDAAALRVEAELVRERFRACA